MKPHFQPSFPSGHASFVIHGQPHDGYSRNIPQNVIDDLRNFANQLHSSPLMNAIFNPFTVKLQSITNQHTLNNQNYVSPSPWPSNYKAPNYLPPSHLADETTPEQGPTRRLIPQDEYEMILSEQDDDVGNNSKFQRQFYHSPSFYEHSHFSLFPNYPQMNSQYPQMTSFYQQLGPLKSYQMNPSHYQQTAQTYQQQAPQFPQSSNIPQSRIFPSNLPQFTSYNPYLLKYPNYPNQPLSNPFLNIPAPQPKPQPPRQPQPKPQRQPQLPQRVPYFPQFPQMPAKPPMSIMPLIPKMQPKATMPSMPQMPSMNTPETPLISSIPSLANSFSDTMKPYISPSLRSEINTDDSLPNEIDVRFDKRVDSEIVSENKPNPQTNVNSVTQIGGNNMNVQNGISTGADGTSVQTGIVQIGSGKNVNLNGDFEMPDFEMPDFKMPAMPSMPPMAPMLSGFKFPKFEMPKFMMGDEEADTMEEIDTMEEDDFFLDDSTIPGSMTILSQIKDKDDNDNATKTVESNNGNVTNINPGTTDNLNKNVTIMNSITTVPLNSTTLATTLKTTVLDESTNFPIKKTVEDLSNDVTTISPDNKNIENNTEIDILTTMESITEISTPSEYNSSDDEDIVTEATTEAELFPTRIDPTLIRTLAG